MCLFWSGSNFHDELDVETNYAKLNVARHIRFVCPYSYNFHFKIDPRDARRRDPKERSNLSFVQNIVSNLLILVIINI